MCMVKKIREKLSVFSNYLKLYKKSLRLVLDASPVFSVTMLILVPMQAALPAATIYLANYLINEMSESGNVVNTVVIFWGITFLLGNVISPFITFIQGKLTDDLTYHLNMSIMKKSESLQTIHFFENSEFLNNIELVSSEASWRPVNLLVFGTSIIGSLITFVSMIVLLAGLNMFIALILLVALLPQAILAYKIQQQAFETLVSNTEDSRKLNYYTKAVIESKTIKEVRLFNLYQFFQEKYKQAFHRIKNSVDKNRNKQAITSIVFLIFTSLASVWSFMYIVNDIQRGRLGVGSILVFSSSVIYILQSSTRFVEDSSLLYDTLLYMDKYFTFLSLADKSADTKERDVSLTREPSTGLTLQDVSFKYPNTDHLVLKNVSFSIAEGEKIAVVGANGAGKSTLVKLLMRLYSYGEGTITFDGVDIETMDILAYRNRFSAVFQDYAKFNLSLRENVMISDLVNNHSDESVRTYLKQSGFDTKELNIGLDQQLGVKFSDGRELSGGQWQKVALARGMYADRSILILDEPTASIDVQTEYELFTRFIEMSKDKTVLFITHRLSLVKQADKVLVLKDGEVVGFDHHDALMDTNSYYRRMYEMQANPYK